MACPLGKTNFPGKHKQAGFAHQAICTLNGRLLAITAPLPRARHDAYAFRAHGLGQFLGSSTLADQGLCGWVFLGAGGDFEQASQYGTPTFGFK